MSERDTHVSDSESTRSPEAARVYKRRYDRRLRWLRQHNRNESPAETRAALKRLAWEYEISSIAFAASAVDYDASYAASSADAPA